MNNWHFAVLIPARNEEKLLPRCLRSVLQACQLLPVGVSSDIIVVSDGSRDHTLEIAKEMLLNKGAVLQVDFGRVGSARRIAAYAALDRCPTELDRCWLANTDADCEVPPHWLVDQMLMAEQGMSAIAGVVDVDSYEEHMTGIEQLFRETYLINPDGTHPHVHGANLGLRADVYLEAGGWADLETAEDHDLWKRIGVLGFSRLSDARLQVLTSGRRVGRAPLGFAGALAAHNEALV